MLRHLVRYWKEFLAGAIFTFALLVILGTGPSTITLPLSGAYRVTLAGDGSFASTFALCDINNPATCVALGQQSMAGSVPVAIASNQSNVPINQTQVAGTAVDTNSGNKSAGTQRIVIATDQPTPTNPINVGTHTSTVIQAAAGTNGFTQAPFSVLTTELNALASAGVATSSVNGTSGKFNQTNTGNNLFGRCWVTLGAALGGTAVAGANLSIWFLTSTDGGTTFESQTISPPPRAPDIIIPVGASNYGANAVLMSSPRVNLWMETVKLVLQNNTGQALGASGNIMTCAGESVQQ